jgi:hypothetical protein
VYLQKLSPQDATAETERQAGSRDKEVTALTNSDICIYWTLEMGGNMTVNNIMLLKYFVELLPILLIQYIIF